MHACVLRWSSTHQKEVVVPCRSDGNDQSMPKYHETMQLTCQPYEMAHNLQPDQTDVSLGVSVCCSGRQSAREVERTRERWRRGTQTCARAVVVVIAREVEG